jgi:2,7-dihydroxy-5-methyl-1-naphthoate 7-O-methyltransferase
MSAHNPQSAIHNPQSIEALTDLCTPWCVHVVATLRVAEQLAGGPATIETLAIACGADGDALKRVLQHLVSKGLFESPAPGKFVLNEAARALLDPSVHLGLDLDGIGGRMAGAWGSLLSAVRTGRPAYHEVFSQPFWEDLTAHPDVAASFDAMMGPAGHGVPDPDVLLSGDWSEVRSVVDVGGGTGSLLAAVLQAHPGVRGVLVDLPGTVARSGELFKSAGVEDRVTTVAQSFFDPLPQGGDLYLLKSVLADWPDAEAASILRRIADAARPSGRIVIVNGVWPDESGEPSPEVLMLVLVGGKQRTLSDFSALARTAGLRIDAAARQASGRFLVECCPQ